MAGLDDLQRRAERLQKQADADLMGLVVDAASALRELSPNQRRRWLVSVTNEMWDEQHGRCALCGEQMDRSDMQVDHKIPFCYGGGNERSNIQLAHGPCNRQKRAEVDPHDLLRYLEDRYMNR